jgi:hypothetical protein
MLMSLPEFCNTGRTPAAVVLSVMADVVGFYGKLLVLSVDCYGRCNIAFMYFETPELTCNNSTEKNDCIDPVFPMWSNVRSCGRYVRLFLDWH